MTFTEQLKEQEMVQAQHRAKAEVIWAAMDKNQKTMVRIGMFPAGVMKEVAAEGFDSHKIVCALMDVATANGGMIA